MISMHYLADLGRLFPLECSVTLYKFLICHNRTQYEEPPLDSHCTGHICRRCEKNAQALEPGETAVKPETCYCHCKRNPKHVKMLAYRQAQSLSA